MKPLTQPETDQLLILLRKIWKNLPADDSLARNTKSVFMEIERKMWAEKDNKWQDIDIQSGELIPRFK